MTYGLTEQDEFRRFCSDLRIKPKELYNKRILDAGCGSGRLAKYVSKFFNCVYGVDIIPIPNNKKMRFVRADITNLPFRDSFFDLVYCEGVLHHTPNPQKAFMELSRVNKKKLFVMVYSKRNIFMFIRKYFVTYMYPYPIIKFLSFISALISYIPSNILGILYEKERVFTFRSLEFFIFDYLSPKYQSIHSFNDVKGWFKEAGYSNIIRIGSKGTRILGIK